MAIYSNAFLYIDGKLLSENIDVNVSYERAGSADVYALNGDGWVGVSSGSAVLVLSFNNAIPQPGAEVDFEKLYLDKTTISYMIAQGGNTKTLISKGRVTKVGRAAGVGRNYGQSVTLRGKPASFI